MQFPNLPVDDNPEPGVSFFFEDVTFAFPNPEQLIAWMLSIARQEQKETGEISVVFCSDEYLRQVNIEHLQHDYYTDIITFQYTEGVVHGDIFISSDRVAENAEVHGVSFQHELSRVLAHGVLHLAGYADKTPEAQLLMRAKENYYLDQLDAA
ncbi:MAG: rRNA maturation RNase YbeY [Lewinellaceae bacterium]|nr:rRNA maturation RNase YbeY [Saprospiraceae bacterium]MCB9316570.1 rRNA maturation RNase YbeY [Lewinellaceae bacterium]MCB9331530.1 rRNA maturation RNase YbeY [Lewinellaceae bacterium]